MSHTAEFFKIAQRICAEMPWGNIEYLVHNLVNLRERRGRLFLLGVGGSAANCSHAVNDFRKLCGIEAYAPTDNVSELTARTNDDGWKTVFSEWLKVSHLNSNDAIMVLSVGGGSLENNISVNLVEAVSFAKSCGARIFGIVGRDGGYTAQMADVVVKIPVIEESLVTPLTESFQALVWHSLVSHPLLAERKAKWESLL